MNEPSRESAVLLGLALAFAVAVVYRGAGDNLPVLAWSMLPLLFAAGTAYVRAPAGKPAWTLVHHWAVLYIAYMAMAIAWSTLPENSFFAFWVLAALPLAFLAASQLSPSRWRLLLLFLFLSGAVSALWGLFAFIESKRRASGPVIDPNAWAAMLNLLFFAALALYLRAREDARIARALELVLLLFAAAFFAAYSRAATVVFVAALVVIAAWVLLRARQALPRLVVATLLVAVAFALVHGYASQSEASHSEGYTLNAGDKGWRQRFAQWEAAWEIYQEYRWTGSGLGTFKVHYPRHRSAGDLESLGNYVHNDYLQLLQEGGPLQLLLVVLLLGLLGYLGGRRLLRASQGPADDDEVEIVGLILAMATAFAHSLLTFTLYQLPVALLLGVYLARIVQLAVQSGELRARALRVRLPGVAIACLAVVPWVLLALDALSYAVVYGQRWVPFAQRIESDPLLFHDTLQGLSRVRPGTSVNHLALATVYRKLMDQQNDAGFAQDLGVTTAVEYHRSLAANPYQYMVYVYYADLLANHPGIAAAGQLGDDPEALLRQAISVAPVYLEPYTALAEWYAHRGERTRAYRLLRDQALPWIDLEHWNFERARLHFISTLLELASAEGDEELVATLESRLHRLGER